MGYLQDMYNTEGTLRIGETKSSLQNKENAIVNVLKFQTLYSIFFFFFLHKFCFSSNYFLKYLMEWQTVDPDQTAPSGTI